MGETLDYIGTVQHGQVHQHHAGSGQKLPFTKVAHLGFWINLEGLQDVHGDVHTEEEAFKYEGAPGNKNGL